MHILITNDDGIDSPLLSILVKAAAARGHRVTVSAPATQQSAKSHAFTVFSPLFVEEKNIPGAEHAFAVGGTPVDSCRLGYMSLAGEKVDLVISGINNGLNAGLATYVSGTVGAAREAAFAHYPAMAVSVEVGTSDEMAAYFADYCIRAGEKLVQQNPASCAVCNVNLPPVPMEKLLGVRVCPISQTIYRDTYERRVSPRGDVYFWLRPMDSYTRVEEGTDLDLLNKGYITFTFLAPEPVDQEGFSGFPPEPVL